MKWLAIPSAVTCMDARVECDSNFVLSLDPILITTTIDQQVSWESNSEMLISSAMQGAVCE